MRIKSVFSSRMEFFFSKENIPKSNDPILPLIVFWIFWIVFACPMYRFNKESSLITTVPRNEWPN